MKKRNLFWIVPLLIVALLAAVFLHIQKSLSEPSILWHNKELHISHAMERPYVVTHLIVPGDSDSKYKSAALDPPLFILDSAGLTLDYDQIQGLKWVDYLGRDVEPPKIGSNISAAYHSVDITEQRIME